MANGTTKASNGNTTIVAGLRADIMRNLMETKNTLTTKGSIYVGTGTARQIGPQGDQVTIYDTRELPTGGVESAHKLLGVANDGDIEYDYITAANFGDLLSTPATANTKKVLGLDQNGALNCSYITAAHFGGTAALRDLIAPYVKLQILDSTETALQEVSLRRKTFSNYNAFHGDADILTASSTGAIIQAVLKVKDGTSVLPLGFIYYPVLIKANMPRSVAGRGVIGSYFNPTTNTWTTLTGDASGFGDLTATLIITYLA